MCNSKKFDLNVTFVTTPMLAEAVLKRIAMLRIVIAQQLMLN